MLSLPLQEFHTAHGATLSTVHDAMVVADYGAVAAEYTALTDTAGLLDFCARGRFCLTGSDRVRLLNGQVTNNIKDLPVGRGCYAAFITHRGRMEADAFIHALTDELLVDVEPGLGERLARRLEHYIIADDVQVIDVNAAYGLLSVQGPAAREALERSGISPSLPVEPFAWIRQTAEHGDLYVMNHPRLGTAGYDCFIPAAGLPAGMEQLLAGTRAAGGRLAGWTAWELARIEAGIPRFGVDMDDSNLPPEAGLAERAIDYRKGCYIGQEIMARIRTYGQVAKALRGLALEGNLPLPERGDRLLHEGRDAGYLTSAIDSPRFHGRIGLGYVRREHWTPGTRLLVRTRHGEVPARVLELPFHAGQFPAA